MASIDMSQAYHSLAVRKQDRDLLQFIFEGKRFRFTCLPNGLASGPRTFTRVMKTVMSYLREQHGILISGYIDDTLLIADTPAETGSAVTVTVALFQKLGFHVNFQKSSLKPRQIIDFLGFTVDATTLEDSVPGGMADAIQDFALELHESRSFII